MCEAYAITIENLREHIESFDPMVKKELLEYVPMGNNIVTDHDDMYNGLECHYITVNQHYRNSTMSLNKLMMIKDINILHNVIVHPEIFEKIKQQMMKKRNTEQYRIIGYKKCIYDSSRKDKYEFRIPVKNIVPFLDSVNPMVQKWLDMVPYKGFVTSEKSGSLNPESYESMYKNTSLSTRQHVSLYHRDQDQCNYNTVNHGINYLLSLTQDQFDFLKEIYINDKNQQLPKLIMAITSIKETNALIDFIDQGSQYLYEPVKTFQDYENEYKEKRKTKKSNQCSVS